LVQQGVTGTLVPADSPAALADAMAEALLEPASAGRRAEAARAHVLARHAMRVVADQYLSLYRTLLHERGARRAPSLAPVPSAR
jgi:glycosyltransferase involved in cell wall biosynthesis